LHWRSRILHDPSQRPACSRRRSHLARAVPTAPARMTDLLIIAVTVALFAAAVGFVRLCERM